MPFYKFFDPSTSVSKKWLLNSSLQGPLLQAHIFTAALRRRPTHPILYIYIAVSTLTLTFGSPPPSVAAAPIGSLSTRVQALSKPQALSTFYSDSYIVFNMLWRQRTQALSMLQRQRTQALSSKIPQRRGNSGPQGGATANFSSGGLVLVDASAWRETPIQLIFTNPTYIDSLAM